MAENVVEFLVTKLVTLLENEASMLRGVRTEFNEIKRELEGMKSFLKDADRRRDSSDGVNTWVEQVRNSAYDVEDIIDEFTYRIGSQSGSPAARFCMGRWVQKTIYLPKSLWARHKVATKLQEIKAEIKAISGRSNDYGFNRTFEEGSTSSYGTTPKWLQHHGESSLFIEEDDIVGIEKERELLLGWLMEDECRRTVTSVYGMGGSGKTTLVGKVYRSQTVKRYFECYAWITVSQTYVIEDLFRSMIKELHESKKDVVPTELGTMNYKRLVETLVDYLRLKRYIVVLDDVWSTSVWREINVAVPDGGSGSRVMLTTRKEDIANFSFGVGGHVLQLQPLKEAEAWDLFCKRAFSSDPNPNNSGCCPPDLKEVARLIVEKCEGLPLGIVAMGGVMSSKPRTWMEWKRIYDSLNYELNNNSNLGFVKNILLLSYNDLPYFLKSCFLYFCAFPEDYIIKRKRLIRLWIAEGFVEERRGMTIEEVADTYLTELISRSMIQVIGRNNYGRPNRCAMHDLMRELALSTSEKENFISMVVCDDSNIKGEGIKKDQKAPRRLSVQKSTTDDVVHFHAYNMSQLRSFFMFITDIDNIFYATVSGGSLLPSGFRLLRVLDLEDVPIKSVPTELVDLFNLRYLSLRKTQVSELPESIGRLRNLQTLDIKDSKVEVLPNGIVKLQNLRHVVMYRYVAGGALDYTYVNGNQVPMDIWKLKNLQVLACIEARGDIIKQIGNMTQLRRIGITKVREADAKDLCSTIQKLSLIHYLFVMMINSEEPLRLDSILSPPPLLQTLIMVGKLEGVPHWFGSLTNVTSLYLHWSQLGEDPLAHIHALPCLGRITLINAYNGKKLRICAGWFLKLQELNLLNFQYLNEMVIDNGAMPKLQKLVLISCKGLRMVPQGIEHLTSLQILMLRDMSEELIKRVRGEDSIDRPRIQHIPEIDHYYYEEPVGWFYESLSLSSYVHKS